MRASHVYSRGINLQDFLSLRCFVDHGTNPNKFVPKFGLKPNNSTVLVLDTETTSDQYQNLMFGSCGIWVYDKLDKFYLFYGDGLKEHEIKIIQEFGSSHGYVVLSRKEFAEKIFYNYIFRARAKCVGFNLPFDLSRLAIYFTESRKQKNGFSFKLLENPYNPNLVIKSLNSKASFIEFTKPVRRKSEKKLPHYRGCFVDLKTLTFSLTNESYSLKKALIDFECKLQKIETDVHGKITPEYIEYNVNDTMASYELYKKAIKRYDLYCINKGENELFSPASIGKAYLEKIRIKPFSEKNPTFPKGVLGHVMSTYYGGRTDVGIRKQPVRVSYIDFTSMYPTVFVLLEMYKFLIADTISCKYTTRETQDFIDRITLDDLNKKTLWKSLHIICKIKPNDDILPVRSKYGRKHTTNIGTNHIKSTDDTCLWYTLPDIIASKLLSGKIPVIEQAITFVSNGIQDGLQEIEILKGISVKPEEDFICKLIEERLKIKKESKSYSEDEKKQAKLNENILKIIANATSYGIFIQIDSEHRQNQNVTVYGLNSFDITVEKFEKQGKYFHPIMSVFLTAGSRLILAATESLIKQNNGYMAYCDTDSVFVSPEHVKLVQDFFKSLNPYNQDVEMFKIEEDKNHKLLDNVWFYGISAKRYVLYDYENETGKIIVYKHSAHGLGHLDNIDEIQWWKDILTMHYELESKKMILAKYGEKYAISQLTINNWDILSRFEKINNRKSYKNKIKPFNFTTVGTGYRIDVDTQDNIIPFLPKVDKKQYDEVPYLPFVDYKTGVSYPNDTSLDTRYYWKPLSEVMQDYLDHTESKSDGDVGILKRKYLTINKLSICYIGKESNELEETQIVGVSKTNILEYHDQQEKITTMIENLSLEEVLQIGLSKRIYYYWKNKIKQHDTIVIKKNVYKKLEKYFKH